ncbi:hypothetical protein, partial [Trueperella pyogenes]
KYAQKQHKMANLEVESDRLKKHQTPPHQQKTRNQQHKMAYKPKESGSVKTRSALFSSVELFFTPFLEL